MGVFEVLAVAENPARSVKHFHALAMPETHQSITGETEDILT